MFKNAYQSGLLSIFYSCGARPLELWDVEVKNGHIKRITDSEVRSIVLEIGGSNVSTTYITCPKGGKALGITLPYMVMIVKNLKKHFTFEVTVLDQTGARRRFRISNFQSTTQILPLCTTMPITLNDGWNQIQFNLAEFTTRSYKTQFMEVSKLRINANIRLRRVYFTESLLPEDQLPPEYKLYIPQVSKKPVKAKVILEEVKEKENVKPSPSKQVVVKSEEKKGSKVDVAKTGSKASMQTIKRPSKDQSSKVEEEKAVLKDEKPEKEDAIEGEATVEGLAPTEPINEEQTIPESDKNETQAEPMPENETTVVVETVPTETALSEPAPVEAAPAETEAPTEKPEVTTENAE